MNKQRDDLMLAAAIQGWISVETPNPYIYSSSCWLAFQVGSFLKQTGLPAPRGVRMGRGYRAHATGMLFSFGPGLDQIRREK